MKRFLAYFLAFFLCTVLNAQSWDAALDQYEQISEECIRLRERSLSGEKISGNALVPLLNQLSSLRKTLQAAGGNMTPEQKRRFESIRNRYDSAFGTRKAIAAIACKKPDPLLSRALLPPVMETGRPSPEPVREGRVPQAFPFHVSALLYVGIPDINPGLMLRLSKGRWGGFIKGSATVTSIRPLYSCRADGTTDAGFIWTTGKEATKHFSVTVGATYSPRPFLSVYTGAGWGKHQLFWEDTAGQWAVVRDRSLSNVAVDAGLILTWKHWSVMAGASTIGFQTLSAELGVGYRF